jgi:hypothetical protein
MGDDVASMIRLDLPCERSNHSVPDILVLSRSVILESARRVVAAQVEFESTF